MEIPTKLKLVSSGCKYAAYLNERTQQILQM